MLTRIMKYVSIAALMVAAILWNEVARYGLALRFVIALGSVMVALQATRARKRMWAAGFFAVAVLYNPLLPLGALSGNVALGVVVATIVPFAISIYKLPTVPLLSMPSITGRNPGSRSL